MKQPTVPSLQQKVSLSVISLSITKLTSWAESRQALRIVDAPCSVPTFSIRSSAEANETLGIPRAAPKSLVTKGYTVAMDTRGTLDWRGGECDGRPLLVITSEDCPKEYLDAMAAKGISWIAAGSGHIDLRAAMEVLGNEFGVKRVAIVGGGHINGAFLQAGLIDEVSVMIGPGIDGRKGMTAVYDGIEDHDFGPVLLDLRSVERVASGTVWLRYSVK